MMTFIDNFILGIALTVPLGSITIEILRRGLNHGLPGAIKSAFGAFSAELAYFAIIYLGLARFSESFFIKIILGLFGILFLFYLAYENIDNFFSKRKCISKAGLQKYAFAYGFYITLFNPLNFFMWAGIIGSFFAQNTSLFTSSGVLFGIFLSLGGIVIISNIGRTFIKEKNMRYVSLIVGVFFIFYGSRLLYNLKEILIK